MTTTLVVGTADLRQALTAVRPHACTDRELPDLARIRFTIGPNTIAITATDRFTAALAVVSVWELDWEMVDEGDAVVELLPEDVAKLLTIFKVPGKDNSEDGPQYLLRFEIEHDQVTVTDCSGFDIVGRRYRMPRQETADTLNLVAEAIGRAHGGQIVLLDELAMVVSGDHLARFRAAATAYDCALTVETRIGLTRGGATVLIRCGESFLGLMVPRRLLDDDLARARDYAEGWSARLPGILAAATLPGGAE